MKRIALAFSGLLLAVVMMVSCNRQTPKEVATTWLNSFYHMDYEAAKKVSTENTRTIIATLEQFAKNINDSTRANMRKINVVIKDVKEEGDKATVKYSLSDRPMKEETIQLVKKDGKWLVEFSKNDNMGNNDADAPAAETDSTGAAVPAADGADNAVQDTAKH